MMFTLNLTPKNLFTSFVIWGSLIYLITLSQVNAQALPSNSIPYQDISTGSLYFKNDTGYFPALTQNSDYQVSVNGLLARVNLTQTFKNTTDGFLEAVYVFPLIDDAAVDSMIMEIGERRIIGEIKEKQQANKLYKAAKQQGKKVSLVTQQRPNLFTTKVANIAPGEIIKISISYLQSVSLKDETFSLRIPLTLTPRFIPAVDSIDTQKNEKVQENRELITTKINAHGWAVNNASVIDASEITPLQTRDTGVEHKAQTVTLAINLHTGLPISQVHSLYHRITKHSLNKSPNNESLSIALADKKILLNQDFVLQWQLSQGDTPKAAFFSQPATEQAQGRYHYGLLMLMPPKQAYAEAITKEVVYIIDTSGSMGGVAIRQAKQSLITALDLLNAHDRFNIIAFDDDTQRLFRFSKEASNRNINDAKQWLSNISAGGGTNMYPAIEQALQQGDGENSYRQVIFITDGSVGNEDELLTLIERDLANTRLHTIGIGSAPNGYFMTQAAKVGRGTYRYIGNINEVKEQMNALFSQISKPLMQNIKLTWPVTPVEMFPKKLPDLYAGEPLLISVRWPSNVTQPPSNVIQVSGQLAKSSWHEQVLITSDAKQGASTKHNRLDKGVAQWWARQKISHLSSQLRRSTSANQSTELKSQITKLALTHHLVSPYTSFIAIEQKISRKANIPLTSKGIKNLMPKGSTQVIPMANTALGLAGYFYLGLLLLLVAFLMRLLTTALDKKTC